MILIFWGKITDLPILCTWIRIWSQTFSLFANPDTYLDPVKSGIVTPLCSCILHSFIHKQIFPCHPFRRVRRAGASRGYALRVRKSMPSFHALRVRKDMNRGFALREEH